MERETLIRDLLNFIKTDLSNNIEDPRPDRTGNFIMTSYPQKEVQYPLITLKVTNLEAKRSGMQVTALDIRMNVEVRVWARNEKEKDSIYCLIMDRLANIQFDSDGSENNDIHDFNILSSIEVDEPGEGGIKSRILQCTYKFYNYD